jgi:hypothetical protein
MSKALWRPNVAKKILVKKSYGNVAVQPLSPTDFSAIMLAASPD